MGDWLKAMTRTATDGNAAFKELAGGYRHLAVQGFSLATATDAEIEILAVRIVGRPLLETERTEAA
jgi:hypothetical protein